MTLGRSGTAVAGVLGAALAGSLAAASAPAALALTGVLLAALVPAYLLLAGGLVMSGGAQQNAVAGSLILADLLFLAWLARTVLAGRGRSLSRGTARVAYLLVAFLVWTLAVTYLHGVSVTPLLRIAVYGALLVQLARVGTNARVIYFAVVVFAAWNIVGGFIDGQTRLVGVYVGDPAQMGALILAALAPLASGELRFPGSRIVALILVSGLWLTQTRSVWFASLVVVVVWWLSGTRMTRSRILAVILAAGLVGFRLVGYVTQQLGLNADSAAYRLDSITNGIRSGMAHPVAGVGWAKVEFVDAAGRVFINADTIAPYNLLVNVFTAAGIPAVLFLCGFLWALLKQLVQQPRSAPLLFAVAVLAMSLTEMTIYAGSLLTVLFFVYSGIGLNQSATLADVPGDDTIVDGGRRGEEERCVRHSHVTQQVHRG